jgi:hypothetical protein
MPDSERFFEMPTGLVPKKIDWRVGLQVGLPTHIGCAVCLSNRHSHDFVNQRKDPYCTCVLFYTSATLILHRIRGHGNRIAR